MSGEERRDAIIKILTEGKEPVSGAELASMLKVSRQVIVQDIALLRTAKLSILSTNRGYLLDAGKTDLCQRTFKCCHTDAQTEEELNCIVDQGGTVCNVYVNHKFYGHIEATLDIRCRRDVKNFLSTIYSGKSTLLKNITSDYHYHQVTAENESILNAIEKELNEHGFLIK